MNYQKVKYELYSKEMGLLELKYDPIGWNEDQRTLERSAKSESFFTKFSNNISFIEDGAEYIRIYINTFGVKGNLCCKRYEINSINNQFEIVYNEHLDLESYSIEDNKVTIGFLSGGLNDLIKSQMTEKFELHRTRSIDGKGIGSLNYDKIGITGRKLFLESFLTNNEKYTFSENHSFWTPTINNKYKSDDSVKSQFSLDFFVGSSSSQLFFNEDQIFYKESNKDRQLKITVKIENASYSFANTGTRDIQFYIVPSVYSVSPMQYDANLDDRILIKEYLLQPEIINIDFEQTVVIDVKKGQSLSFFIRNTASTSVGFWQFSPDAESISMLIEEDSVFPNTQAKALTFKDALVRALKIITGRNNVLKSDFFSNTIWKDLLLTSGILLREFPETTEDDKGENKTNGIVTSLDELLSIKAHLNIGWGVERVNNQEYFRVEPLEYFFQYKTVLKLKGVFCPKRSIAKEYIYGSVSIGNEKAGEYEEQQGLFEYNALTSWTTSNTKSNNRLELKTGLRTDLIGMEYARRNSYSLTPTKDTKYDLENFVLHCYKMDSGTYRLRRWQDDFEEEPKQAYDPASSGNLLLSPLRSLEKHGWILNTSLFVYPNDYVRFSNSKGNANLITKVPGQIERGENKAYQNKDLRRARFVYQYLDFDFPNSFEIKRTLNGYYIDSNGNYIPNFYGLVEFTNENGEQEQGWILKSIESDLGSFRLIKAYR